MCQHSFFSQSCTLLSKQQCVIFISLLFQMSPLGGPTPIGWCRDYEWLKSHKPNRPVSRLASCIQRHFLLIGTKLTCPAAAHRLQSLPLPTTSLPQAPLHSQRAIAAACVCTQIAYHQVFWSPPATQGLGRNRARHQPIGVMGLIPVIPAYADRSYSIDGFGEVSMCFLLFITLVEIRFGLIQYKEFGQPAVYIACQGG